jgi:glycosyltransferase involved in cell wall biosynthesis
MKPRCDTAGLGDFFERCKASYFRVFIMNILFLSRWFPFPPNNGSKIRIHNLLRGLSKHHEVTLLSFYDPTEMSQADIKPYPFCYQMQVVPWKPFDQDSYKARLGFFSITPRSLLDTHSPEMELLIRQAIAGRTFDIVIASQLTMASYYPAFAGTPAIFEEVELGIYVDQRRKYGNWLQRLRLQLTWLKLQWYFSRLLRSFSMCTVVSEQERRIFTDAFPASSHKVQVFPNSLNVNEYEEIKPTAEPHQLIFSGSFRYYPNYMAMQWFIENVFPLILEKEPQTQLIITGDTENLPLPNLKNVTLAGYVDDIKSLIAASQVSIIPLWSGGGTRLKILEAMALGTPVVSTSKGAEGLHVTHGENILIADDPRCFAEGVLELLRDDTLRGRLSSNARQLVRDQYNWATRLPEFLSMAEKVAVQ